MIFRFLAFLFFLSYSLPISIEMDIAMEKGSCKGGSGLRGRRRGWMTGRSLVFRKVTRGRLLGYWQIRVSHLRTKSLVENLRRGRTTTTITTRSTRVVMGKEKFGTLPFVFPHSSVRDCQSKKRRNRTCRRWLVDGFDSLSFILILVNVTFLWDRLYLDQFWVFFFSIPFFFLFFLFLPFVFFSSFFFLLFFLKIEISVRPRASILGRGSEARVGPRADEDEARSHFSSFAGKFQLS